MLNRSAYRTAHGLIYRRLSGQEVQAAGSRRPILMAKIYYPAKRQLNKVPLIGL